MLQCRPGADRHTAVVPIVMRLQRDLCVTLGAPIQRLVGNRRGSLTTVAVLPLQAVHVCQTLSLGSGTSPAVTARTRCWAEPRSAIALYRHGATVDRPAQRYRSRVASRYTP